MATVLGILLALGILAMSVGLVRSETASDLRTLTATGASSLTRRTITAATAAALALAGAVTGVFCAYLAAIGFFRSNQLDGLSELSSIPVANLLLILVGLPLLAVIAGWLLAGRQPPAIGRQPMEYKVSGRSNHSMNACCACPKERPRLIAPLIRLSSSAATDARSHYAGNMPVILPGRLRDIPPSVAPGLRPPNWHR